METERQISKRSGHIDPDQRTRFIEAARELGADDDAETFKAKLRRIARQKVKDAPEPPEGADQ